jgi:hypothetical protein
MKETSTENKLDEEWDIGLTENELTDIGSIVAHWGAMEHEIFVQTIDTFDATDIRDGKLPREMNNLNFSQLLELWKERVVDRANEKNRSILTKQYEEINRLSESRNALIHGMWHWNIADPKTLIATRIRQREIIHVNFNDGDLNDFASRVAQVNLLIRYPGGITEFLTEEMAQGGYVNHAAIRRIKLSKDD